MAKYTQRSESDVGIALHLGSRPQLVAVIKERFSDFHVNEIRPDGTIVTLTSLNPPLDATCSSLDSQIGILIPQDVRQNVVQMQERLSSKDKKAIKKDTENIQIKVTHLDKESRTHLHRWISSFDKLNSETVEKDGDKFIKIVAMTENNRFKRRPANRAKYTHCVLYKEGIETSDAIGFIATKLNLKPGLISYAGIKDKRAKTSQRIAVSNIEASRLVAICKYKQGMKLGNFEYHPKPIALGELGGNHFKLLLKNLQFREEDANNSLENLVSSAVQSLSSRGFVNYYGMQRFGSYEVATYEAGLEIFKQNWVKAFDLILGLKPNDPPSIVNAKTLWLDKRDPVAACQALSSRIRTIESNLLYGLARSYHRNDFVSAFLNVPRHQRLLYVHAYQSLIWNQVASYRVEEYGSEGAVVGDLVAMGVQQAEGEMLEELVGNDDVPSDDASFLQKRGPKIEVKALSQEDIDSGKYTIYDVLIPLYGSDVKFPENKTTQFLLKLLKEDGIDGECFEKFRPIGDKPNGGYRKLIVRPTNVSHEIRTYCESDVLDSFIQSDWDLLKSSPTTNEQDSKVDESSPAPLQKNEDNHTKNRTCLILEFSLPSSSYATMALREIIAENAKQTVQISNENNEEKVCATIIAEGNDEEPSLKNPRIE